MKKRNSDKLQNAMQSLEDALKYTRTGEFQMLGIEFKSVLISAVVQNFSLTFAVCRRMIQQQLLDCFGKEAVDGITSEELFRKAESAGLISDANRWIEYLDSEHLSPSSNLALRTFEKAAAFLEDASELHRACVTRPQNERRRVA